MFASLSRVLLLSFMGLLLFPLLSRAATPALPTCAISTPPGAVYAGTIVRLIWVSDGALKASISEIGDVPLQGYRDIRATGSKQYVMTVSNAAGKNTCKTQINVASPPIPVFTPIVWSPIVVQQPQRNVPIYSYSQGSYEWYTDEWYSEEHDEGALTHYFNDFYEEFPAVFSDPGELFTQTDSYTDPQTGVYVEHHYDCYSDLYGDTCDSEPHTSLYYDTGAQGESDSFYESPYWNYYPEEYYYGPYDPYYEEY